MPTHNFAAPRGRLENFSIESQALRDNLLGDPAERLVHIYLPEGYDDSADTYPLFVALAGFFGSGAKLLSWQAFGESLVQRIDRLVAEGRMGKAICVLPDSFTSLGGNQYVDSPVTGFWESFLIEELLPSVEKRYRVRRGREHRALFGKSSGGYGALLHGMKHADHWGAVACHAADMGFEWCYLAHFPSAVEVLARHESDVKAFLQHVMRARSLGSDEMQTLMLLAMAASYAPDLEAPHGIRLPVDSRTCEIDVALWARWLDHDPMRMARYPEARENLRRLNGLFIDCGVHDEYKLVFGARQLAGVLEEASIPHRYEEFEGGHLGLDHRMDSSLPFLFAAVSGQDAYALRDGLAKTAAMGTGDAASSGKARAKAGPVGSQKIAPPGGVPGGCPKCLIEVMEHEVHGEVEIERCPVCKGIFLDKGELEVLFSTDSAHGIDALTSSGVAEMLDGAAAWCMRCGREMGPVRTIADVLVNVCDDCGAIFLDQGELAALELFRS